MKIWTFFLVVFIFSIQTLKAQDEPSKYDFAPCGTLPEKGPLWLL